MPRARSRIDIADYDAVVSDIYDAAFSPVHWDVALTNMISRFGRDRWDTAMLVWERLSPPGGRFVGASGVHAMARQGYVHSFAGNNEWSINGHELPVGTVLHSDRLIERTAFRQGAFFRDYLSQYEMEVGVLALLDRHARDHLSLCMPGPDNGPTVGLEAAVKLLLPHIQRSVRIGRRIGEAELSASSALAVLDGAPSAIIMCNEKLRITYCNRLGRSLLGDGYIGERHGQMILPDRAHERRMRALADPADPLRCAAFALEHAGRTPVGAMAVRIDPRAQGVNPAFGEARIMIVAGRNHRNDFANVDHLRDWFGLTPAEARLAATLSEGGSLDDFAATRGITLNAARFLLKGIFAKTGTNRQPQLVARLQATPLQWHFDNNAAELPSPVC